MVSCKSPPLDFFTNPMPDDQSLPLCLCENCAIRGPNFHTISNKRTAVRYTKKYMNWLETDRWIDKIKSDSDNNARKKEDKTDLSQVFLDIADTDPNLIYPYSADCVSYEK